MTNQYFTAENSALLLIDHQVGTMQLIKNIDKELAAKPVSYTHLTLPTKLEV